ncbi:BTB/POZ protein [Lasiosphaeris hirsuta]|uniref:BTB/POZ protein n=1 Tax=Lasiosphaeris hirsuta TaxID=260670 RepID=A0AA40E403_9PEZI|nr:BTB/POZ protein [Lasiosphaeris hirsuta]
MDNRFLTEDEKLLDTGWFSDVTVKCGDRIWRLHKNILCTRSVWFEKALTGRFEESKTGHVDIQNFDPEAIGWLIRYIYTGICDIPALRPGSKTNFVTCYEVHTVADYFAMTSLAKIALDTLAADFDARLGPVQMQYEPVDWLDELFETVKLIYQDVPLTDTSALSSSSSSPIRHALVTFVHTARFYLLQNEAFTHFLDEAPPVFALDMFRAMRTTGDFLAHLPEPQCFLCRNKPTRSEKAYYTHLAPEKMKLHAACATCANKRDLLPCTSDWSGKGLP